MGFLVSQHGQLGVIPPPHFLSVSPVESMRSGGAIPPPSQKGYLRANEIFHVGAHQFRESLRELLRELWQDFVLFKSWDAIPRVEFRIPRMEFKFRELLREYPGTLRELREWPFHSESVFLEIGVVSRLLTNDSAAIVCPPSSVWELQGVAVPLHNYLQKLLGFIEMCRNYDLVDVSDLFFGSIFY